MVVVSKYEMCKLKVISGAESRSPKDYRTVAHGSHIEVLLPPENHP